jgi:two-component system, NarL family, sensor histidine kinase UhpB
MATIEPTAPPIACTLAPRGYMARRFRSLLALPLLYRVLIANSVVILIGATVGTYLATMLQGDSRPYILVAFVLIGLLLSVVINWALLKFALYPLTHLRDTMRLVQDGDLTRQAPVTGQDPDADQLATSFNTMLVAIEDLAKSRASQILHAQEQERKRIARELHDETSQLLTSLLISLKLLEESTPDEAARARVVDIRALAHQTLRAVRNLSIDLRPSALDDLGLLPALRWYIKEYQQKCGIEVEFAASGMKERLPPEMETAVYRIIQESLTNTAKHAHATKVVIALTEEDGQIHARISDNGRGYDALAVLRTPWQDRGLGLAGMTERASLLNGTVDIQSEPGNGAMIDMKIPVTRAPQTERRETVNEKISV